MKETGIIKKIDDTGRLTIPRDVRKKLHVEYGGIFEILLDDDAIILRKRGGSENTGKEKRRTKQCAICGKTFTYKRDSAMYCSDECRKKALRSLSASWRKERAKEEEAKKEDKKDEKKRTLSEKVMAARELGMSYGQYQAMLYREAGQ